MKKIGRILTAATVIILALCMSVSAATFTTTSTYFGSVGADANTKIVVTTTVSDVAATDMVTYYVEGADDSIVYLDQATAAATTQVFEFETTAEEINGAAVSVAGATAAGVGFTATGDDAAAYTVTYTVGANGTATNNATSGAVAFTNVGVLKFAPITADDGYKVASVSLNGAPLSSEEWMAAADGIYFDTTIAANAQLAVTFENVVATTVSTLRAIGEMVEADYVVTGIAQIAAVEGAEYGLLIADSSVETVEKDAAGVVTYAAKGRGSDGRFAIRVIDKGADNLANGLKVRAYATVDGNTVYGVVKTIAAPVA